MPSAAENANIAMLFNLNQRPATRRLTSRLVRQADLFTDSFHSRIAANQVKFRVREIPP